MRNTHKLTLPLLALSSTLLLSGIALATEEKKAEPVATPVPAAAAKGASALPKTS